MLNHRLSSANLIMNPGGSLNSLVIAKPHLAPQDPLLRSKNLTGKALVSRQALIDLLHQRGHPMQQSLRQFLINFDPEKPADADILTIVGERFLSIIEQARANRAWQHGNRFQQALHQHWNTIEHLVLSGGLTSHQFGRSLADYIEQRQSFEVIASPWGGTTALFGLAQTVALNEKIVVMDFGSTGIKRGIAHKFGNRIEVLPDAKVSHYKEDGLIRKDGLIAALRDTRQLVDEAMLVAISMACYLNQGHPVNYRDGIYHRLYDDCEHLATALDQDWLSQSGFAGLALLEHDSTAAALAFQFKNPAMMVTLGTGLGSAACPAES